MRALLLLITLLNTIGLNAQSRFSVSASSGYWQNYRKITSYESSAYKKYRNSKETYLPSISLEATVQYRLSPKLALETGFGSLQKGYIIKEDRLIDPGFSPHTAGFNSELTRYRSRNYYVPLHLIYTSPKRLFVHSSIGSSLLLRQPSKVDHILRREVGKSGDEKVTARNDLSDYRDLNISLDLGLGIGYRLTPKWSVALQPQISYELLGNENSDIRDREYTISLFTDENKSTREHLLNYGVALRLWYNL